MIHILILSSEFLSGCLLRGLNNSVRGVVKNPTVAQLVKKFSSFYGT
jgi:hypothetical protein